MTYRNEILRQLCSDSVGDVGSQSLAKKLAVIIAAQDETQGKCAEVKPLEWEAVRGECVETYQARCTLGFYRVFEDEDNASGAIWIEFAVNEDRFCMIDAIEIDRIYGQFEQAKAAAQSDYERRILSAITIRPASDVAAEATALAIEAAAEVGDKLGHHCVNCGHLCGDPKRDLEILRKSGARSCCPEREMEPISETIRAMLHTPETRAALKRKGGE